MSRKSSWIFLSPALLALILIALSCGEDKKSSDDDEEVDSFSLSIKGSDFGMHANQTMRFVVFDRIARTLSNTQTITPSGESFTVDMGKVLKKGGRYNVHYYADMNGNGTCDAPPTDHVWTFKLDNVIADKTVEESHQMNFADACAFLNNTYKPSGNTVAISGILNLDAAVEGVDGLTAGQALAGATVFAQGFPDQEAMSNADGTFTLNLDLGEETSLTATNLNLTMWYTQPKEDTPATTVYDFSKARFGATKDIQASSGQSIDIGAQNLTFTTRVRFKVTSSANDFVPNCWVDVKGYSFQLVALEFESQEGDEYYGIDYMPPGDYQLSFYCLGHQPKTVDINVDATEPSEWLTLDPIELETSTP